ncbi:unnamed protein product [Linum trigynum]|uniref:RNase H type-1 domain-containing protein n=1 Tax=Linum trigynum TaxID=586398 RepID=A0AAV2EY17_9ROSI
MEKSGALESVGHGRRMEHVSGKMRQDGDLPLFTSDSGAEAFGLLNAIRVASQDNIPTCIRTDCQVLSLALHQEPSAPMALDVSGCH